MTIDQIPMTHSDALVIGIWTLDISTRWIHFDSIENRFDGAFMIENQWV
jgi:hypothetical protein